LSRGANEAPRLPEPDREPSDDQVARDRELLDYLVELAWTDMLRKLRNNT